ncbi:MAG TPA: PLP-dependent cysteine synthase family protein [Guyparkeria sp.]|nr:PLP-dependent cysteine synthase family protein [Guyparkeria sp.]
MTILDAVGNTPLVRLESLKRGTVEVWAKLEYCNPSGSVKDRAALAIIDDALSDGALVPGMTIVDSSSGNAGIAYAMVGAALGYPVKIWMSASASEERKRIIRAYGAELVLTDPALGSDGAYTALQERLASNPACYFWADQYGNASNWQAHERSTGPEIWGQSLGQVTHIVAGIGTGGTLRGVATYLTDQGGGITTVGVVPDAPKHGLAGLRHLETAMAPAIYDAAYVDREEAVSDAEARAMVERVAAAEGIYPGPSGGAALVAAERVARELDEGFVVAILADSGERYLSNE